MLKNISFYTRREEGEECYMRIMINAVIMMTKIIFMIMLLSSVIMMMKNDSVGAGDENISDMENVMNDGLTLQ